jgi:hypothetical protein
MCGLCNLNNDDPPVLSVYGRMVRDDAVSCTRYAGISESACTPTMAREREGFCGFDTGRDRFERPQ